MASAPPPIICTPFAATQRVDPTGVIPAGELFRGAQEILIVHNSEQYRLRITKNGKLILTK
ncbi:MAG: hemin uptake protein HemP [Thiobacillus sp.]